MKALKIAGIVVGSLIVLIVVIVIVGSRGTIFTGGVPVGKVNFTSGDIPGVPAYPGAIQTTDNTGVTVPDDMRRVIPQKDDQWKRYLTSDSPEKVLAWYDKEFLRLGLNKSQPRESGMLLYTNSDTRYGVYAVVAQGKTNIILAVGKE